MRKFAFVTAAAAGFCLAALSTVSGQAQSRHGSEWVASNVSYDVCKRRLNRGQECLYPYWHPYWSPDLAYQRSFKSVHVWPYWNWFGWFQ